MSTFSMEDKKTLRKAMDLLVEAEGDTKDYSHIYRELDLKDGFDVPFMTLWREDLSGVTDDWESLSEEVMVRVANKLSDWLASDWSTMFWDMKDLNPEMFKESGKE